MNWKGFFVIILVFLAIYAVYYFVTQIEFARLLSIPRAINPFSTSSPVSPTTPTSGSGAATPSRPAGPVVSAPAARTPTPPQGFTEADLSPHFEKAQISWVRPPNPAGIGAEFTLRVGNDAGSPIDVTGWYVRSNRGSVLIRGATTRAGPANHPAIVIRPGTSAVFYAAWGSFVKNLELNTCTGYLNDIYTLSPAVPNDCPRPPRSELINFSGACQNFINSLSSCKVPEPNDLNRFTTEAACRAFLNTFSYQECVERYRGLSNFNSYGWRVWLGTEFVFDLLHDRLLLFDAAGKLVDEYIY